MALTDHFPSLLSNEACYRGLLTFLLLAGSAWCRRKWVGLVSHMTAILVGRFAVGSDLNHDWLTQGFAVLFQIMFILAGSNGRK